MGGVEQGGCQLLRFWRRWCVFMFEEGVQGYVYVCIQSSLTLLYQ